MLSIDDLQRWFVTALEAPREPSRKRCLSQIVLQFAQFGCRSSNADSSSGTPGSATVCSTPRARKAVTCTDAGRSD